MVCKECLSPSASLMFFAFSLISSAFFFASSRAIFLLSSIVAFASLMLASLSVKREFKLSYFSVISLAFCVKANKPFDVSLYLLSSLCSWSSILSIALLYWSRKFGLSVDAYLSRLKLVVYSLAMVILSSRNRDYHNTDCIYPLH